MSKGQIFRRVFLPGWYFICLFMCSFVLLWLYWFEQVDILETGVQPPTSSFPLGLSRLFLPPRRCRMSAPMTSIVVLRLLISSTQRMSVKAEGKSHCTPQLIIQYASQTILPEGIQLQIFHWYTLASAGGLLVVTKDLSVTRWWPSFFVLDNTIVALAKFVLRAALHSLPRYLQAISPFLRCVIL